MKTNHTPGPWTRTQGERFKHDQSAGVKSADGMYIVSALDLNRYDRDEEVEANARLIAAAPELLDALRFITEQMSNPANENHTLGAFIHGAGFDMAMKAIAKATDKTA